MTFTNPFVKMMDAVKTGTALWAAITALGATIVAWKSYMAHAITFDQFWAIAGTCFTAWMAIVRNRLAQMKGPVVSK